jgi:TPP-dependent pyruvate/acetoin dehydrogenase alpha subunit
MSWSIDLPRARRNRRHEMASTVDMKELYRRMLRIRRFEEKVSRLYAAGEIPGFVHLYIGEEAVAVGVCSNLSGSDYITSTHRGHGHLIAKGGDVRLMMAELYGKKTGYCKGKGGSMHIADLDLGILGANGIVAGGLPIAVGAGYSIKLRKSDQVAVAFFGDGATNEGAFHEAVNMAAAWSLPVVFVCENNQFGVGTRIDRVTHETDLTTRAGSYGIPGVVADGNDVVEVQSVSAEAIGRARKGDGPTLIVARTFRHRGHFEGEVINYWDKKELADWKCADPITCLSDRLRTQAKVSDADLEGWQNAIDAELDEAVEFARQSEFPQPEDALEDLFSAVGEVS